MNFFIWRKHNVSFSRYLDFYFAESTYFKICDVIISIATWWKLHLRLFFWILSTTKMDFCQILVFCMTNISDMFLVQCWRLETSSRVIYDFTKITIQQDLAIFNNWHLPFLIVFYSSFQKNETLESWHDLLLSN